MSSVSLFLCAKVAFSLGITVFRYLHAIKCMFKNVQLSGR